MTRPPPPLSLNSVGRGVLIALALLVLATVARSVAWMVALPPWQASDEPAHYAYVERLASGELPPHGEPPDQTRISEAVSGSLSASRYWAFRRRRPARPFPPAPPPIERRRLSQTGSGALGATSYPPAYYAAAVPLYAVPGLATATERLYAVRAASALLAVVLVVVVFLLALELTSSPWLALAAAALATLPPMLTQASATANPDILVTLGLTGVVLGLVRLERDRSRTAGATLVVSFLAACLAKPIGAPMAALVVAAFVGVPLLNRRIALLLIALAAAIAVAAAAALAVARPDDASVAFDYLRQFYVPSWRNAPEAWDVWVEGAVGRFGWLAVELPLWSYVLAFVALVAAAAIATVALATAHAPRVRAFTVATVVVTAVYVTVLHVIDLEGVVEAEHPILQGRYLVPLMPLYATVLVAAPARIGARTAAAVSATLIAVGLLVSAVALDAVLQFYGT